MKNNLSLVILGVLLLISTGAVAGPIIVGNGAGEGEYSVIFARVNLAQILEECAHVSCHLSGDEQNELSQLQKGIPQLPAPILKTTADLAGKRFETHGKEVWINSDLLWRDSQKSIPYNLGDAADLWIRILSSSVGISAASLKDLGQKIQQSLDSETHRGHIDLASSGSVEFILWSRQDADTLVIRDPSLASVDISGGITKAIHCAAPVKPRVYSPAWMPLGQEQVTLQFGVSWSCQGKSFNSRGIVSAALIKAAQKTSFDPESIYTFVEQGFGLED